MNAPIDTLTFAQRFETAGFAQDQARVLASAFGLAQDSAREGLVTKDHLDARMAEMESRLNRQLSDLQLGLARQIADNGKDISGRLWSTVTIIAGVSTAISATIGAVVALVLKWNGL